MLEIYVLKTLSAAEEYIQIEGNITDIKIPLLKSELQYLNKEKIVFDISEEGGLEIPDALYYDGSFLVSDKFKRLLDSLNIDYIFWKPADIHSEQFGIHETFWIMVPPRIDCLDIDESVYNTKWDFQDGLLPMLEVEKIIVDPKLIGRFHLFKILGVLDNNIYVTNQLVEKLKPYHLKGVCFFKL